MWFHFHVHLSFSLWSIKFFLYMYYQPVSLWHVLCHWLPFKTHNLNTLPLQVNFFFFFEIPLICHVILIMHLHLQIGPHMHFFSHNNIRYPAGFHRMFLPSGLKQKSGDCWWTHGCISLGLGSHFILMKIDKTKTDSKFMNICCVWWGLKLTDHIIQFPARSFDWIEAGSITV